MTPFPLAQANRKIRARRWGRNALLAWLAWLLVSTLVLNQPLMEGWINRKPVRAHVSWDFAVSLVPGHVLAWGVDLRGHSRRQAWAIHARRAHVWFVPWGLAARQIRLAHLRAHDAAVHVQPGRVVLPPPPPKERPWTVALPDLRASDLRSVVVEGTFAATGLASARLDLRKVLSGGEFEISNGQVDWHQLDIAAGTLHPVYDGHLKGEFALGPLVPSRTTLREKFQALHTDLVLDLKLPSLALDDEGLRASDSPARGRLSGRLVLDAGAVGDQTAITLAQPLHVDSAGLKEQRELTASVAMDGERVRVDASLPPGEQRGTLIAVQLSLPRRAARVASQQVQAGLPAKAALDTLDGATGTVDLRLRFQSLSLLRPWLARLKGLEASGEGWLHAQLRLDDGKLQPESQLVFEDASLRLSALGHQVDARMDGPVQRIEGPVRQRRVMLQSVQVRGPDGELLLSDVGAILDLTQARPDDTVLDAPTLTLRMDEAAIPDLRVFNRYLPPSAMAFGESRAALGFSLTLQPDAAHANGTLSLVSPNARVHLAGRELDGTVNIRAELHDADLAKRDLVVKDLHVDLDRLTYRQPGRPPVSHGWLRAHAPTARALMATPIELDGEATVAMADLRLLLEIYAERSAMPRWLLRLTDAGQVDAAGHFAFRDGALALDNVRVSNDRYSVKANLRLAKDDKQGRLLVQWGKLSLGVGMAGGKTDLRLRGARDWYEAAP